MINMIISIQRRSGILTLLIFLQLFLSCSQGNKPISDNVNQVTAIDSRGKEIKLDHPATRVIALYESIVDDVLQIKKLQHLLLEEVHQMWKGL